MARGVGVRWRGAVAAVTCVSCRWLSVCGDHLGPQNSSTQIDIPRLPSTDPLDQPRPGRSLRLRRPVRPLAPAYPTACHAVSRLPDRPDWTPGVDFASPRRSWVM